MPGMGEDSRAQMSAVVEVLSGAHRSGDGGCTSDRVLLGARNDCHCCTRSFSHVDSFQVVFFFKHSLFSSESVKLPGIIYETGSDNKGKSVCFQLYSQFPKIQPRTSSEEADTFDFDLLTDPVNPFCSASLSHPQEKTGIKNVSALYSPETTWFQLRLCQPAWPVHLYIWGELEEFVNSSLCLSKSFHGSTP